MASGGQSLFNGVIDASTRIPWPVGLGMAVLVYLLLHAFAAPGGLMVAPGAVAPPVNEDALPGIWGALAYIFQYLLPMFLVLQAGISFIRWRDESGAVAVEGRDAELDMLDGIDFRTFCSLVAATFRREGYLAVERGGSGDGGVDLELFMGRDRYLVQCKHWQSSKVSVAMVRDLFGMMNVERAVGGFIVTSGRFSDEARVFAMGRKVRLVPVESLRQMLKAGDISTGSHPGVAAGSVPPACPVCGKRMLARPTQEAGRLGQDFWLCSSFPACRGRREK